MFVLLCNRLYYVQDFLAVTKEQVKTISSWRNISENEWVQRMWNMAGRKRSNLTPLIVPSIDWSLNIVLVSQECLNEIYDKTPHKNKVLAKCGTQEMLFVQEHKSIARTRGVSISNWVLGDPQVSRTRVTYEYLTQYKSTYGSGYGSRMRSSCLDSVNSYRDKRFNARVHPSPLIHDRDIGEHQYFSCNKQRLCLLQMKLESVLHSLTSDVTHVAERVNPYVVKRTSGLSTKLIATTGQSLYSFCNGLHTDTCDRVNDTMKSILYPTITEEWQEKLVSFEHFSFPTTCGYQHVWKKAEDAKKYIIHHYFVMPGLGLAVALEDSIAHHFMGGDFAHCTSVCVLQENFEDTDDNMVGIRNQDDIFSVFAWGSSANSRTARGNIHRINELGDHRDLTEVHRQEAMAGEGSANGGAGGQGTENGGADGGARGNAHDGTVTDIGHPSSLDQEQTGHAQVAAKCTTEGHATVAHTEELVRKLLDDDNASYSSYGFEYEDDDYESDVPTEKRQKVMWNDNDSY